MAEPEKADDFVPDCQDAHALFERLRQMDRRAKAATARLAADLAAARSAISTLEAELDAAVAMLREVEKLRVTSQEATPGRWWWHTSNSWLRLGTDAQGRDRNGTPYDQDGYIAYPYISRGDRHPDLCIRNQRDQDLIVRAVNTIRTILADCRLGNLLSGQAGVTAGEDHG